MAVVRALVKALLVSRDAVVWPAEFALQAPEVVWFITCGRVEKYVEREVSVIVVDAPVRVRTLVAVVTGVIASNSVETAENVDVPLTVESVVSVAVGTRHAIVPFCSSTMELGSFPPPESHM